ncbi:MAG: LCP family protein [Candidatus Parcubacteria bacterium]|nr:LCP family protein [Candidatus Parcubacteria bacterium]
MHKKIAIIIGIFLLIFFGKVIITTLSLSPFFFQLFFNQEINLKKTQDRVNVLLLGVGGGVHDGPYLTDTIIFASLDPKNNKVTLVSIPRDLWIVDLDGRINTAYSNAEYKKKGGGVIVSSAVVNKVIQQPVDYVVRIDFSGFVKAVDLLGGINVNVENELDDLQYPLDGKESDSCGHTDPELQELATASSQLEAFPCRYKHIHFSKGIQQMNGEEALEFVRSRHAKGDEGSDFARSKRQEEIIKAIKDKIFSLNFLINPSKLVDLYNVLRSSIDTNIKEDEFDDFLKLASKMKQSKIESAVLDYGDDNTNRPGLLFHPDISTKYNNEWVLIPRLGNNNFSEIQKYIDCEIKIGNCTISSSY